MSNEEPPSEEGLRKAIERFSKASRILKEAMQESIFDPPVDWTPEMDKEESNEKDA